MTGNPNNAAVWQNADVYIGALTATIPSGGAPFDATWDHVGLLNGDDGFSESISMDTNDFFAWGGILVATTRRNFKLTRSFTAYEDNKTVLDLWYPGNTLTHDGAGGYEGDIYSPDLQAKFLIAFETRVSGKIKRVITTNYAQVDERGDSKEGENDLASRAFTIAVYPDAAGKLFHTYKGAPLGVTSIAATPPTVAKAVGASQQLTVTATLSNAATEPINPTDVVWSSSAPSKATVSPSGLVTGVATGSAVITATYGGRSTTVAATIS